MNSLPSNFDQNFSPSEVKQAFQSDPDYAADAATVLYFKLLEVSQQYQLLQGQFAELKQAETTTNVNLPPFLQRN